jgi:hypothetical protein
MASLTTVRRISGIALIVGWAATLAVGIGTLQAGTGRMVEKGVAVELSIAGLSLAATFAYGLVRLGRAHIDDIKWALDDESQPVPIPRQARTGGGTAPSAGNVYPLRKDGTG